MLCAPIDDEVGIIAEHKRAAVDFASAAALEFCCDVLSLKLQPEQSEDIHQPGELQSGGCGKGSEENDDRNEPRL